MLFFNYSSLGNSRIYYFYSFFLFFFFFKNITNQNQTKKKGSACVGLKSKKYVVLAALKRSSSQLGSFQPKIFRIDDHIGIAVAGLTGNNLLFIRLFFSPTILNFFDSVFTTI